MQRASSFRHLLIGAGVVALALAVACEETQEIPQVAATEIEPRLQPRLPDLDDIVVDEDWARVLGKALFWDSQVGSDGVACASCHFQAGADARITNALSPGFNALPEPDTLFGGVAPEEMIGLTGSGGVAGPNYTLTAADFPIHQLSDEHDRNSPLIITSNDRVTSSGSFPAPFGKSTPSRPLGGGLPNPDTCGPPQSDIFHIGGIATRQAEARHTPTTINAVFNYRNFWDGRANNRFNGVDPFGRRSHVDPTAGVIVHNGGRDFQIEQLDLPDASLASQAVGPPLSALEMSCAGRSFADVGRKMLRHAGTPLARQEVHEHDSLLGVGGPKGDLRDDDGQGLSLTYRELIERAFHPRYWAGPELNLAKTSAGDVQIARRFGYSQTEHNFSMFFGIAVMMYEATLVSDQSRWDRAQDCIDDPSCDPVDEELLTQKEVDGRRLFGGFGPVGGRCTACHGGDLFTAAAATADEPSLSELTRVLEDDGAGGEEPVLHDVGFFNVGTRPVWEDPGLGGFDPYGTPLSHTRQYKRYREHDRDPAYAPVDGFIFDPCDLAGPFGEPFNTDDCSFEPTGPGVASERVNVDGTFKTPGLRNVALTPPYFHYGGYASLEQVVEFYAHGGNRRDMSLVGPYAGDDSGTGPLGEGGIPYVGDDYRTNVDGNVRDLNLALGGDKDQQYGIDALVAFMKTLTDERVQCDAAPFDHPSLVLFTAHQARDSNRDGRADDVTFKLPAVGAQGYDPASGLCIPNSGDLFAPGMQARVGGPLAEPD